MMIKGRDEYTSIDVRVLQLETELDLIHVNVGGAEMEVQQTKAYPSIVVSEGDNVIVER